MTDTTDIWTDAVVQARWGAPGEGGAQIAVSADGTTMLVSDGTDEVILPVWPGEVAATVTEQIADMTAALDAEPTWTL